MNVQNVKDELFNAHISVMTAEEVKAIGADKITERGHMFGYTLGSLKEIATPGHGNISKVWAIQVTAPGLSGLRKSYGLSPLLKDEPFHITVAVRKRGVLSANDTSKGNEPELPTQASSRGELKAAADQNTTYECNCSGKCTCPETCVCKQHDCGCATKTAAKDLLPGGTADNKPDSEFPPKR
jgi:hypothetical protein